MTDLGLFVVLGALGLMMVVVLLLGVTLWLTQEESERLTQNPDLKKLLKGFLREIAGLVRWLVYLVLALAGLFVAVRFVRRLFVAA